MDAHVLECARLGWLKLRSQGVRQTARFGVTSDCITEGVSPIECMDILPRTFNNP